MELCEGKGDYSFMYASTQRDERSSYQRRPALGMLHSTLPWHCLGEAQRGERDPEGIRLKNIVVLEQVASLSEPGRAFVFGATTFEDNSQSDAGSSGSLEVKSI